MQQLTIVGHVGQDAEVKDIGNTQVINFSLACTEKIKDENVTTWYKCAYFTNNVAVAPWLTKGSLVGLAGKPGIESYVANDGTTKSNLKITIREIKLYSSTKEKFAPTQQSNIQPSVANSTEKTQTEEEHDSLPF